MAAGGSVEVTIPIKPVVELGPVEITLKCITQFGLDVETATVQVQVRVSRAVGILLVHVCIGFMM